METVGNTTQREPWNKGKIVGQKAPFKPKDIWALRVRLQMEGRIPLARENSSAASTFRLQPLLRCSFSQLAYLSDTRQLLCPGFGLATLPVVDRLCADPDQLAHVGGR